MDNATEQYMRLARPYLYHLSELHKFERATFTMSGGKYSKLMPSDETDNTVINDCLSYIQKKVSRPTAI